MNTVLYQEVDKAKVEIVFYLADVKFIHEADKILSQADALRGLLCLAFDFPQDRIKWSSLLGALQMDLPNYILKSARNLLESDKSCTAGIFQVSPGSVTFDVEGWFIEVGQIDEKPSCRLTSGKAYYEHYAQIIDLLAKSPYFVVVKTLYVRV